MRLVDEIPEKLLDCPEVEVPIWPAAFACLGRVVRIDYSTELHGPDDDGERVRKYAHVFSSGVEAWTPATDGDDVCAVRRLEETCAPIAMGVVDRVLVAVTDTRGRERVVAYERADVEDDVDDNDVMHFAVAESFPLEPSILTWDPESRMLIAVTEDGAPALVLLGGFLGLDPSGLITG